MDISGSTSLSSVSAPLNVAKQQQELVAEMALKLIESAAPNTSQTQSLASTGAPLAAAGSTSLGSIIDVQA